MRKEAQTQAPIQADTDEVPWQVIHWPPKGKRSTQDRSSRGASQGHHQSSMDFAAVAEPSSSENKLPEPDERNRGRERAGHPMKVKGAPLHRVTRSIGCPYCRAATYHLRYEVYPSGILASGKCTSCGTRGRSFTESSRSRIGETKRRAHSPPL